MAVTQKTSVLAVAGSYWIGVVLVVLIVSGTAFPAFRDFVASLNLFSYLGLWVLALLPGLIMIAVSGELTKA